jgi:hypothetical protein
VKTNSHNRTIRQPKRATAYQEWRVTAAEYYQDKKRELTFHWFGLEIRAEAKWKATDLELSKARRKFANLLRNRLPLQGGRCQITIGYNVAEITSTAQQPLSGKEFKVAYGAIREWLENYREGEEYVDKSQIGLDWAE